MIGRQKRLFAMENRRLRAGGVIEAVDFAGTERELDTATQGRVRVGLEIGINEKSPERLSVSYPIRLQFPAPLLLDRIPGEDCNMATAEKPEAVSQEDRDALQEAIDRAVKGIRDSTAARRACEEMDQAREQMRRDYGERNLAVDLIRESRDER
jgi:hypothetical protein